MHTRFAIYFCPEPETELEAFGRSWLGWDLDRGATEEQPHVEGFDIREVTQRPRKYGFHGTLKAPFRLRDGKSIEDLQTSTSELASMIESFDIPRLHVSEIGNFLAITEAEPCAPLREMAGRMVEGLERFRAPLSEAELEHRRKSNLTPAQDALLIEWGYPHVFHEFKFHLTLSGPLDTRTRKRVRSEAERLAGTALENRIAALASASVGNAKTAASYGTPAMRSPTEHIDYPGHGVLQGPIIVDAFAIDAFWEGADVPVQPRFDLSFGFSPSR